jgi:hypothetical protein
MDRLQSLSETSRQRPHRLSVQRTVLLHRVVQRRSWHVGRCHPRHLPVGIGVDDGRGEYATDVPGGCHLAREAVTKAPVLGELSTDHLDGDYPPAGRTSNVYPPHAAGPKPPE